LRDCLEQTKNELIDTQKSLRRSSLTANPTKATEIEQKENNDENGTVNGYLFFRFFQWAKSPKKQSVGSVSSVFVFSSSDNLFNVRYVYFNKINSRTDCNI